MAREKAATSIVSKMKKNFFVRRSAQQAADATGVTISNKVDIEREDLRTMQKEITMLEVALDSTQEKLNELTKEAKVMRQILHQPQGFACLAQLSSPSPANRRMPTSMGGFSASPSPFAKMAYMAGRQGPSGQQPLTTPEKVDRRFNQLMSGIAEAQASPASILHHLSITSHRHLSDQILFWKKMAMVRLNNSMVTLKDPGMLKESCTSFPTSTATHGDRDISPSSSESCLVSLDRTPPRKKGASSVSVPSSTYKGASTVASSAASVTSSATNKKTLRRRRVELLLHGEEYKVDTEGFSTHNKALYRSLRKLRAETIRIASVKTQTSVDGAAHKDKSSRQAFITFRIAH
jgi:hypothetical protein